ncbi:uncharacterized protein LOC142992039 [Genypterus blacodes]|uniref:uncharacterized protein LOC142992039 n=1 Tax=Genypterus blacodes TaxID=154954 RepID=UPI003F76DDC6
MAYRRAPKSIRDEYEDRFQGMDTRQVMVQRVVNIEKRKAIPRPEPDYDRGYGEDQWYGGPRNYSEGYYSQDDRRYVEDHPNFGSFRRNSPPPRNDGQYAHYSSNREDHSRRQVEIRRGGRSGPYHRSRGRGLAPHQRSASDRKAKEERDDFRRREPIPPEGQAPLRKEPHPALPARTIVNNNNNNRDFSPDRDDSHTYQQVQQRHKPNVPTSHTPSTSAERSPRSSGTVKEKPPASAAEPEEVVPAASVEPKLTPEDDFKVRRSEAIKVKALEIEKLYRQDCETFATVVKMLADKEPSTEKLLQVSLDKNLLEMKQRCLDDLKHFIKELDQVIQQPDTSA